MRHIKGFELFIGCLILIGVIESACAVNNVEFKLHLAVLLFGLFFSLLSIEW